MKGLIIAAPSSGAGKTTITLGLLRAFKKEGWDIRSAKSGPDYIDPRFHEAASDAPCFNLDAWAMSEARIKTLAAGKAPLLIEGAMGMFDGAPPDGEGATADLARILGLPVLLVVDAAKQSQSVAALVSGFANHDPAVKIVGIVLNKVGSDRHERLLRLALKPLNVPVVGAIHRNKSLSLPSRHLGLVQAKEHEELNTFLDDAATQVSKSVDIQYVKELFSSSTLKAPPIQTIPPPAQKIAIAQDLAFAFTYPHMLADWRAAGAEIAFFSPLADETPPSSDLVYLPGGYPELHAGRIASNTNFMKGIRAASAVYGECGGYMVMGDGLVDEHGVRHEMAGLLRLETSFAARKLHLGYRRLTPLADLWKTSVMAHEFHFATTIKADGRPMFEATDAEGNELPPQGLVNEAHSGSFFHVIDLAKEQA